MEEPPLWAQALMWQQQCNAQEPKWRSERAPKKASDPDTKFKYEGNRKRYELNKSVIDKMDEEEDVQDKDERHSRLVGKQILIERNKHSARRKMRLGHRKTLHCQIAG